MAQKQLLKQDGMDPKTTPPSTTFITYDAEENLLGTTIDEHTIERSEPN